MKSFERQDEFNDVSMTEERKALGELDFGGLLKELRKLEKEEYLSREDADGLFDAITFYLKESFGEEQAEEKMYELFKKIMQRLIEETNIAQYYQDTIGLNNLLLKPTEMKVGVLMEQVKPKKNAVTMKDKILVDLTHGPREMLEDLAFFGVEQTAEAINHELIHVNQGVVGKRDKIYEEIVEKRKNILIELLHLRIIGVFATYSEFLREKEKEIKDAVIINETQSHLSENFILSPSELLKILKDNYRAYRVKIGEKEKDKILTANTAIKRLYAMGLRPKEVTKIIAQTNWDESQKKWLPLEDWVEDEMKKRKITPEVADTMVDAWRMRKKIERLKVMKITQEELKKIYDELDENYLKNNPDDPNVAVDVDNDGSLNITIK